MPVNSAPLGSIMRIYASNQEFYERIDSVVVSLRSEGFAEAADQIDFLLHKVAWTTSSELFGELRARFEQILNSPSTLPSPIRTELNGFIVTINQAWNRANSSS
jgi:hypothetical protein